MIGRCPAPSLADPAMRALLDSVDCNARSFSEAGYLALGGPHAVLPGALAILLTLYVALIGYRLLFGVGGARLSDAPLIALKIGVVLTLATGWASFQTLVFDTANEAPAELARTLAAPARIGDPVAGVQAAHDAIIAAATRPVDSAPGAAARPAADAADHALFGSATLLFLSTVGVLAMAKVATAMLTAIGPIFIALLLFEGTRGLFVGWVRALIAVALVPLLSGATTVVALLTLRPALEALTAAAASAEAASRVVAIVQIFAGAQALLLVGCALLAAGFRLPRPRRERAASASPRAPVTVHPSVASPSRAARLAEWVAQPRNARPLLVETGTTMIAAHHLVRGSAEPIPRALRLGEANRRPAFRPRRAAR